MDLLIATCPVLMNTFFLRIITAMRNALVQQVSPRYIVKLELHIYVRELAREDRRLPGRADVGISAPHEYQSAESRAGVIEAPTHCFVPLDVDVLEELLGAKGLGDVDDVEHVRTRRKAKARPRLQRGRALA